MRKDNVWKQAMALVLSAALVFGNSTPVSAATGDPAANDGAGTVVSQNTVTNQDAYSELALTADGEMVSGDDAYAENGIQFTNNGVEIVDAPIITPGEGQEAGDDGGHGKVFKFSNSTGDNTETGRTYLTSVAGSLSKYDFSRGATFSFDFYPEVQSDDWNYLFGIGTFSDPKYALVGTIGFSAGLDSEEKRLADGSSWEAFTPSMGWITENKGDYEWDYFKKEENAHKWYNLKYVYTSEGMTISVNNVPIVTYRETNGYMKKILEELNKGVLRLGKGVVIANQGYVGLMDNISIQPMPPHQHSYEEGAQPSIITEPTCVLPGSRRMPACKVCGVIETQEIPALGHDVDSLIPAKDATCTEQGNIAHYKCKRCSGFLVSGDDGLKQVGSSDIKTAAKGHTYVDTITKKATATEDGVIKSVCSACPEDTTGHTKTGVINKASNITLEKTSYTYTGKAITPKVTVKDSKGTVITTDNYTVTYSNNTKVGTATAKITFKGDKYTGVVNKTFSIKVAASLKLSKSKVTLYTGKATKTATIKATVTGASKAVSWKSSNTKVAKVDKKGKITAVKAGKATITAKANGISKKVTVTVKNPTIAFKNGKKAVKKNTVTVKKKKSVKITVTVKPSKSGYAMKKLSKKDKKIATVTFKKGKLTIKGKKKGTVKVKITSGKATKTLTVKVK